MNLFHVPLPPKYSKAELAAGCAFALLLHVLPVGALWWHARRGVDDASESQTPLVAKPIVQAALLKLGKPIDPSRLPDRLVPQKRSAPQKHVVASPDEPMKANRDAGAPPANADVADLENLVAKSDPFAEASKVARAEEGHVAGIDGGSETDPNKVRAGDMFAHQLGQFFAERLSVPTVVSVTEERRLCVVFEVSVDRMMRIFFVAREPVKRSGNELFDDAAHSMLDKLLDDKVALPEPPKDVEQLYRGRRMQLVIAGRNGDPSRCLQK